MVENLGANLVLFIDVDVNAKGKLDGTKIVMYMIPLQSEPLSPDDMHPYAAAVIILLYTQVAASPGVVLQRASENSIADREFLP
jgi:hypothetical protein